ncbi:MAG: LytTR family DNA-binding domain-containing protein [Cyclobacteriaceae bacterium]
MLLSITTILLGSFYAILLISGEKTFLKKDFLQQSLLAISLIVILYIYGEQDRFLISVNPLEDLIDFSFILFLIIVLWVLTTFIFRFFRKKFNKLRKSVFLVTRGIALVIVLIPLDILFNYLFLDLIYDLQLYEDYLVLEVPFKIIIVLLVNFLDEVVRMMPGSIGRPTTIKIKSGNSYKYIKPDKIAYFLIKNQISYLYTISGEKFVTDLTLTELEKALDNYHFFRASRQLLIARKAVEGYRPTKGKKIQLSLTAIEDSTNTHYISRLTAPVFRKWISDELGTIQS